MLTEIKLSPSSVNSAQAPKRRMLSIADVDEKLRKSALETMESILIDTETRLAGCVSNPGLLNKGIFSATQYFEKLKQLKEHYKTEQDDKKFKSIDQRLAALIKNGSFIDGFAAKDFFTPYTLPGPSVTGKMGYSFRLADGKSPTEALRSMIGSTEEKKFYILGCSALVQLVYTKALLDLLGQEKFDNLFAAQEFYHLEFSAGRQSVPLLPLISEYFYSNYARPGDWIGIKGLEQYHSKHWHGNSGYWNILFQKSINDQPFYIGSDFPSEGISHKNLLKTAVKDYNTDPVMLTMMSKEHVRRTIEIEGPFNFDNYKMLQSHQLTLKDLTQQKRTTKDNVFCFNAERIHELLYAPIDKSHALMKSWLIELSDRIDPSVLDFSPLRSPKKVTITSSEHKKPKESAEDN